MKTIFSLVGAGLIALTVAAADTGTLPSKEVTVFNKASAVIGMSVKDSGGKELGKVEDLVVDLARQQFGYAVVSLAGAEKARIVAVPVSALKPAGDHFVLNMSAAVLASAASIQNDDWPSPDSFAVGGPAQNETGQGSSPAGAK